MASQSPQASHQPSPRASQTPKGAGGRGVAFRSGRFPSKGPCETLFGNVLLFIQRMLHSISSKSIVLPYGKYRGWPTPLPSTGNPVMLPEPLGRPKIYQKSTKISINFRYRFWIDLGSFWGANLASFSAFLAPKFGQVRSKTRLQSLSRSKNVNFHQILRLLVPERYLEPQDGLQNAPRSVQDRSKTFLKRNFFVLENRLQF